MRTVVFLCEHNADGSFGFVLNRPYEQMLEDFVPDLEGCQFPVFYGGPVQPDTLHFLHRLPDLIPDAHQVAEDLYWGGDFPTVVQLIQTLVIHPEDIRFFLGYSGWSEGQLTGEIAEKSWLVTPGTPALVFHTDPGAVWRDAIHQMDEKFHPIVHYPIDPQLN